jgi:polyhydroxyalkanoate synthesis regulator phasin
MNALNARLEVFYAYRRISATITPKSLGPLRQRSSSSFSALIFGILPHRTGEMAEFEGKAQLSGMAGEIRTATTSEQFDLGGYTEQRAADLMKSAFSSPLTEPTKMVKFTFVVGGGKLVRSKYNDDLSRWLISALRDIGFTEDRSAAETFDSQGTFKQQHDTGQNLKYLIVYPFVQCANKGASGGESAAEKPVDTSSPEYIVCACESATFKDMVASKVTSYKQKKHLLQILQASSDRFKEVEAKLVSGSPLTPAEQAIYDSNSGADAEKITWLQGEIKHMVDEGKLTAAEKQDLLQSIDGNLTAVCKEIEEASSENKPKKVEKLAVKKDAIVARKAAVTAITPIKHRLSQSEAIQKLYMRLFPLLALEDKGRSMSLTLADLKTLEEKSDIEDAIRNLENVSRGWFVDEADFAALCQAEAAEARDKYVKKQQAAAGKKTGGAKTTSSLGGKSGGATGGWGTVPMKKGGSGAASGGAAKAGKGGFAAAFGNQSDSD